MGQTSMAVEENGHTSEEGGTKVIKRFTRPLPVYKKEFNDVYITNRVPICVYFRRCVDILRFQLPNVFKVYLNLKKAGGNDTNLSELFSNTGIYLDSSMESTVNVSSEPNGNCIRIFASGSCLRKAFYVLQDFYGYLYNFYVDSVNKYLSSPNCYNEVKSHKRSFKSSNKNWNFLPEYKRTDHLVKDFYEFLKLFEVDISTDSIRCVDDLWVLRGGSCNQSPEQKPQDSTLEVLQSDRYISSVVITISLSKISNHTTFL